MAKTIPFGADSSTEITNVDTNVSFGKLFAGGTDVYIYIQNKVKRTTTTKTTYASCASWIVYKGGATNDYPLEGASLNYQDEPNIIWKAVNPGEMPTEFVGGADPDGIDPATTVDCIQVVGCEGSYQISVKGPENAITSPDPKGLFTDLGASMPNITMVFTTNKNLNKPRTDFWVFTLSGRGYFGGPGSGVSEEAGATISDNEYGALAYSANARGDLTVAKTVYEILDT